MKLSFSLSSKSQPKKPIFANADAASDAAAAAAADAAADAAAAADKEYLTAFESSPSKHGSTVKEFVTEFDPSSKSKQLIIPPKPNEWRPKMKNLELPLDSEDNEPLQFVVDNGSNTESGSDSVSYGLNLRQQTNKLNPGPEVDPVLHKVREDVKKLPEVTGFQEYEDMPIESFATALLAGYGWKEGRGIGRNAKEDVKVKEYKQWTGKDGLGFTGEAPGKLTAGKDGKVGENRKTIDDRGKGNKKKHEEKGGLYVGKEVRVVEGMEMGMKGRVLEVKEAGEAVVLRLSKSEEEIVVRVHGLAELGSIEEERCLRKLMGSKIREKDESSRDRRDNARKKHSSSRSGREGKDEEVKDRRKEAKKRVVEDVERRDKKETKRGRQESRDGDKVLWLRNHIRVRIVSKELKGGRLYLKKGKVVDVAGMSTCDIQMDESRELIQGIDQDLLETALPKRGGPVLVLYGRHRGVYGSLVERDMEQETGVVREAETHELLNVKLEQIAEYVGDPSEIGY